MRSRGPSIFAAARAAPSDSFLSGRRDHLGREQAAPPTRDQRPRATPYTAGDGASDEPGAQTVHQAREGVPPPRTPDSGFVQISHAPGRGFQLSPGLHSPGALGLGLGSGC